MLAQEKVTKEKGLSPTKLTFVFECVGIFRLATEQFFRRVDLVSRGDAFIRPTAEENIWRGSVGKRRTSLCGALRVCSLS